VFFGALCGGILVYYNSVITNGNKISVNLIPQIVKQVIGVINNKTESNTDSIAIQVDENKKLTSDSEISNEKYTSENSVGDYNNDVNDSTYIDSLAIINYEETITIKKEELVASKELVIQSLENFVNTKQNKSDSLLAIVSGTKDESKKGIQQKITVELWKSPINYKGYQASKNKIVFFGLTEINEIKLISYKNDLLVKYKENVYSIVYSSDFNSYEKVLDVNLLNQINKINP